VLSGPVQEKWRVTPGPVSYPRHVTPEEQRLLGKIVRMLEVLPASETIIESPSAGRVDLIHGREGVGVCAG
jgi:hypothetical protein